MEVTLAGVVLATLLHEAQSAAEDSEGWLCGTVVAAPSKPSQLDLGFDTGIFSEDRAELIENRIQSIKPSAAHLHCAQRAR